MNLNERDINIIMKSLVSQPYYLVAETINKIQTEINQKENEINQEENVENLMRVNDNFH